MTDEKRERLAEIKANAEKSGDMWPDDWGWLISELETVWSRIDNLYEVIAMDKAMAGVSNE